MKTNEFFQNAIGTWTWNRTTSRVCTTCALAAGTCRGASVLLSEITPWLAPRMGLKCSGGTMLKSAVSFIKVFEL